jgi:hypothetical protein
VCNRCWRTRGGRPIRLGNRPRRIPTETSRRIKASFTRVIDPTLQRINFTTLLGRRHPPRTPPESRTSHRTVPGRGTRVQEQLISGKVSASFFYCPPSWHISFTLIYVIRPGVTSPETTRSLALGSFFIIYHFTLSFSIFCTGTKPD